MSAAPEPSELDLSGRWRAAVADDELRRRWHLADFDDRGFVDIDVPAHWRAHPEFATSDGPLLYRRPFHTLSLDPEGRAWLVLDQLCAQGDVWLDGAYLGDTEGAFTAHEFEVTDALHQRHDHVLAIEVTSPSAANPGPGTGLLGTWVNGPYVSHDWNPGGLGGDVQIKRTGPVAVVARRVLCSDAHADRAVVTFWVTLDARAPTTVTITSRVGSVDHVQTHTLAGGANDVTWSVPIDHPNLWWPAALGDQPLVDVAVDVHVGDFRAPDRLDPDDPDDHAGALLTDRFSTRIGLRRITMRDWILSVNGEQLFCKGVLAGPAAEALGTAPADRFDEQIAAALALGANLVRIHGHLSRPELYDAADRTGMLLWQDLPLFRGQARSARRQAVQLARAAVERLGSHPSIAIWCGHDEPDEHVRPTGTGSRPGFARDLLAHQAPNWNRSVLDRAVRRALTAADPSRPVVASSGVWPHPPSLDGTDVHLSLGWHRGEPEDLPTLARTMPRAIRFVEVNPSPSLPADASFSRPAQWPELDVERLSEQYDFDPETFERRLPPDAFATFDEWWAAGRAYQAQLVRLQVETLRRLKYRPTGGVVVGHLRDLRPAFSSSLIDHDDHAKPAHDALRDAYAPVIATFEGWPTCTHPGETVAGDIHVISDVRRPVRDARCAVRIAWDDGSAAWEFGGDLDPDRCTRVGRVSVTVPDHASRLIAEIEVVGDDLSVTNTYSSPVHDHH